MFDFLFENVIRRFDSVDELSRIRKPRDTFW